MHFVERKFEFPSSFIGAQIKAQRLTFAFRAKFPKLNGPAIFRTILLFTFKLVGFPIQTTADRQQLCPVGAAD